MAAILAAPVNFIMNTKTVGPVHATLASLPVDVAFAALELSDAARRCVGYMLDAAGLGPVEMNWRAALAAPGFTLRAYHSRYARGAAILLVPAPIKRPYIWDLSPVVSVVRRCLDAGLRAYLIDWARPSRESASAGLSDYADRFLDRCLARITTESTGEPVFLAGHSLGGTLAAIFASLHPERIAGLILLDAPLHFGREVAPLDALIASAPPVAVTDSRPRVPGTLLDVAAACAAPAEFAVSRSFDFAASFARSDAVLTHLRVERWSLDESAMPHRLFVQVVESLYRHDEFMRRRLVINQRLADPRKLSMPLLVALSRHSALVPPQSVIPLFDQIPRKPKLLWYEGDIGVSLSHLGMLVGSSAHRILWPRILRWIHEHTK